MKKKVLVTGAKGFIGSHLGKALADAGIDAVPFDTKMGKEFDIFGDLIESYIKQVDVVVHLAAFTSVEKSFKNPSEMYRVNVLGTARIAELCYKYKKKLIFPSSGAVYHASLSPYAQSKVIGETILTNLSPALPVTILRLYNVYGPDMNPDTGSIMYNFLTSKKITIFGDGEQTRDFVHVRDVVAIIIDAIKNKRYNGVTMDVGTGEAYSINYIADLFAYYQGKEVEYKIPRREIKWSLANTQMLKKLYGKPLFTHLESDIKKLISYYHEN